MTELDNSDACEKQYDYRKLEGYTHKGGDQKYSAYKFANIQYVADTKGFRLGQK